MTYLVEEVRSMNKVYGSGNNTVYLAKKVDILEIMMFDVSIVEISHFFAHEVRKFVDQEDRLFEYLQVSKVLSKLGDVCNTKQLLRIKLFDHEVVIFNKKCKAKLW